MAKLTIGWTAGFLEGEGCFSLNRGKYAVIDAVQQQREPLERLQKAYGVSIHRHSRGYYRWTITTHRAVELIRKIWPYMSPKRRVQILKVLKIYLPLMTQKRRGR